MNRINFIFYTLLTLFVFSCEKYDYYSDSYKNNGLEYEKAFTQYVGGDIAPEQTWGFSDAQMTRTAYPNLNMWEDEGYPTPPSITEDEIERVKTVFAEKMDEGYVGTSLVDWTEFFVQHVFRSDSIYKDGYNQDVDGSDHMDWLCSYSDKEVKVISFYPYEDALVDVEGYDDHIYNFNAAYGSIQLMFNTTTKRFGFHCSSDDIIHYNFRMEEIDGAYYVGFDFEGSGSNPNQQIKRDYVFDDWIVKICPGKGYGGGGAKRIIVEDLVASDNLSHLSESDWDYNDAVFDVVISDGKATITVQAAGGTLPIYVAGHELHEVFGLSTLVPVNVNFGVSLPPKTFTVSLGTDNLNDIPVVVRNKGKEYELLSNKGQAPAKICVGCDYEWCVEKQHIKEKYPKFAEWATKNPKRYDDCYWYE